MVLAVGLAGLIAGCAAQYGLAYLIPALRAEGLPLETATLLVTAPIAGILCTLIAWGAAADRWGERRVLALGLAGAAVAEGAAALVADPLPRWIALFGVGATSSAIHAASGRLILGWFAVRERGLAMGIRQTGQPLGVGVAALVLPAAAGAGVGTAFVALGAGCAVAAIAVALLVRDPERPPEQRGAATPPSPYRDGYLWRIHAASGLLVVPQFTVAVFAFDFLVTGLGWSLGGAGLLLAATQLGGAAGRLLVGWWSDQAGTRLGPMRAVAIGATVSMAVLAMLAIWGAPGAVAALLVASVVTTAPNGLAFTAVAERAGMLWAGRALGTQNTIQNLVGLMAPTPLALLIGIGATAAGGYGLAFAAVVGFPAVAALVIPVSRETAPA